MLVVPPLPRPLTREGLVSAFAALFVTVMVAPLMSTLPADVVAVTDRLLSGEAPTVAADDGFEPQWSAGGVDVAVDASVARMSGGDFELGLQPVAFGWAEALVPVGDAGAVEVSEGRSVQAFDGFDAWYVARDEGVEQGFTIAERPEGAGQTLQMVQEVSGDLLPVTTADGQGVRFLSLGGAEVASYDGLAVWDAEGTVLPARMETTTEGLVLEVDAVGAVFPVTIDPVITSVQARLTAREPARPVTSDATGGDRFGFSVDVDGDTAVVGAPFDDDSGADSGSAYVYVRSAGAWTVQAKLLPQRPGTPPTADGTASDEFGIAVGVSGDTIIVGSHFDRDEPPFRPGSAYVYTRSGGVWTVQARLVAQQPGTPPVLDQDFDRFGSAVGIDGDTVVVGASFDADRGEDSGSAYVYSRTGEEWTVQAELAPQLPGSPPTDDVVNRARFGLSVAIHGSTIVVGGFNSAAYVYAPTVGGGWEVQAKLVAQLPGTPPTSDDEPRRGFGYAVDIDGDGDGSTIVVGSIRKDIDRGAAYVYVRSGTEWIIQARLLAQQPGNPPTEDREENDQFGRDVGVDGDTIVVGSYGDDDNGSGYVYTRSAGVWTIQAKLLAQVPGNPPTSDGVTGGQFGDAVAVSGDAVLIGSTGASGGGAAYVYNRSGDIWPVLARLEAQRPASPESDDAGDGDEFGYAVAVDGDTVVIGSPRDAGGAGSAYVYVRSDDSWSLQTKLRSQFPDPGDLFGFSVDISGETIIVGSYLDDSPRFENGSAYVFVRTGTDWAVETRLASGEEFGASDYFGIDVAIDGDIVVVGEPFDAENGRNSGSAYIYAREGGDWNLQANVHPQIPGDPPTDDFAERDEFGFAVGVDGGTVIVGSGNRRDTGGRPGAAYVYTQTGDDWTIQAKLTAQLPGNPPIDDAADGSLYGFSLDIDGDTAVIGSPRDDAGFGESGSVYVYTRMGDDWTIQAKLTAQRPGIDPGDDPTDDRSTGDLFGWAVDVEGDRVVVGSRFDDDGGTDSGSAYAYRRAGGAWTVQAKFTAQQPGGPPTADAAAGDEFGYAVAVDGITVLVGSRFDDEGVTDSGSAYVHTVDDTPSAVRDELSVVEDTVTTLDVLENDVDPDGGPIAIASVTQPVGGTVTITNDGAGLSYEPDAEFCTGGGPEEFSYTLAPGGATATVSVNVTCVDDGPVAVDDAMTVTEDDAVTTIDVLGNDTDVDDGPIAIDSVTQPAGGSVVVTNDGADLTYQPNPGFCTAAGTDDFSYTLTPGGSTATVAVTVICVEGPPTPIPTPTPTPSPTPPAPDAPTVTAFAAADGGVAVTVSNTAAVPQDGMFSLQIDGPAAFDLPEGCVEAGASIDCVIPVAANDDVVVTVGIVPTGLSAVTVTGPTGVVQLPVVIADPVSFAVQASNERFPAGATARAGGDAGVGAADHVVLARNDLFADALGGSVLSATGPLLFTPGDSLDARTVAEIQRVVPDGATVYLLGGPVAISAEVAQALTGAGYSVVRLEGASRVETAVAVADQAVALYGEPDLVGVARADSPADNPTAAWADAVSAGGWAARTRSPILLTQTGSAHPATRAWLADRAATTPVVLGGEAAITATTAEGLDSTRRVSGPNRFATAVAVASELWPVAPTGYLITPASDDGWAYTLAAAGLAADTDQPILLTELDRLPAETDRAACSTGERAPTGLLTPSDSTSPQVAEALASPCAGVQDLFR